MIHSHVRNVNYVYDTLNYNIPCIEPCIDVRQTLPSKTNVEEESLKYQSNLQFKWIHTPHLLCKNNTYEVTAPNYQQSFLESVDNKYFQLPIDKVNNYKQWNIANVSHIPHQKSTYFKKKLCKTGIVSSKQNKMEITNMQTGTSISKSEINCGNLHNEDQDLKKYTCTVNENKIFNMETQKRFELTVKPEQQAIQEDIFKMDVVCWNEKINTIMNSQVPEKDNFPMDNFIAHRKLQTSLQTFLKRAEQETFIKYPTSSQTKSMQTVPATSKCWKLVTRKNLENKNRLDPSINGINNSVDTNSSNGAKKSSARKALGLSNIYPKLAQLQMLRKSLNIVLGKAETVKCEKKDTENLPYKSAVKQTERNNVNILQQTASVTKLSTFKKQYYDTLLNIQQAKVAVANSLAISSVEDSTKYDPYYSNRSYQQQQLLQQHGQLIVNPQFAVHTMAQSKLSNIHNAPYTWVRYNDWRHPTVRQLKFPQQSPFHHSRNKENSILHYVKTVDIQCFAQDKSKETKQCVQRNKLEDIVGKLKEIENIDIND
ncbi:uncharacterized protein LOC122395075 [Colletes gigas]|uniref:uncharacterized protein LOC122395075 n=1 Tax=Colletes gigas TaxID=935657 RepID=UPI001C9A6DC0|nr:uncharacterized protein LOC122395075 [Colletes gigas]